MPACFMANARVPLWLKADTLSCVAACCDDSDRQSRKQTVTTLCFGTDWGFCVGGRGGRGGGGAYMGHVHCLSIER